MTTETWSWRLAAPPELGSQEGVGVDVGRVLAVPAADLALLPVGGQADDPLGEPALFGRLDREPGPVVPPATRRQMPHPLPRDVR